MGAAYFGPTIWSEGILKFRPNKSYVASKAKFLRTKPNISVDLEQISEMCYLQSILSEMATRDNTVTVTGIMTDTCLRESAKYLRQKIKCQ